MSNPLMEKMLDLPEFEVTDFKQNVNNMICPKCHPEYVSTK